MKRKIDEYLLNWKNNRRNALIVYGARQVGKSYSIEKFIKNNSDNYILIDFSKDPGAIELFESFSDKNDFYNRLFFYRPATDNCIIFFDEIQELYLYRSKELVKNPNKYFKTVDLITLTKDLVQDGKYRFIFSGSMLGVTLNTINLNPTGYLDYYIMYPMDFEEYLWASGVDEKLINHLMNMFNAQLPLEDAIHSKMLKLFYEYILVGGMPEAIKAYLKDRLFKNVSIVQSSISHFYNSDILKYAPDEDKLIITEIYRMLASEVNNINKRFTKNHLNLKNVKNLELIDKYLWLTNSGIALAIYNVTNLDFPLKLNEERKVLKLFYGDVGLLSNELLGSEGRLKFLNNDGVINYGAPFENAVAQELVAHGFKELHYYNSKKIGEIDFIIEIGTEVIPIEIKSGKTDIHNNYDHKALDHMLENNKAINKAYMFSKENIFKDGIIVNYPIYMIMFLHK